MMLISPNGAVVDASEQHAAALIRDGWKPVEAPAQKPEKAPRRRTTKAAPKEV